MCDDCIVVNGQRQIIFTRALSVCNNKVSYSEPTDSCNQSVKILHSSVHITINSDHYTADRSQVVNIHNSDVCIEVRESCTGVAGSTRTVNISDSEVSVVVPYDMTSSIASNESGVSTVVVPVPPYLMTASTISEPLKRESVEYASVSKEPKTGQTVIGPSYSSTMNKNGGYTALNRIPSDNEQHNRDYCAPTSSNQILATIHVDCKPGNLEEVPLVHISPYPSTSTSEDCTKPGRNCQ